MNKIFFLLFAALFSACTSAPPASESKPLSRPFPVPVLPPVYEKSEGVVDQVALQRALGLERNSEELGFQEKMFNTCNVGYGYSSNQDCQNNHFVVIHYRLRCRDSEGTVSQALTSTDLAPLANREIKWTLPGQQGLSQTNSEGYGQIKGIFSTSQRKNRLKLGTRNDFLYVRAGEINEIVTPRSWCPF